MNVNNLTALLFKLFLMFGILLAGSSVYSLFMGERGRVRSGIGLARLVRRGEIRLRCALGDGAAQGTTRTHATHLDTLCLCRPVSIPLSLVSCLSCISCLLCEVFCFCLASVLSLVFFSVCPSLCPSLCVCLYVCASEMAPLLHPRIFCGKGRLTFKFEKINYIGKIESNRNSK